MRVPEVEGNTIPISHLRGLPEKYGSLRFLFLLIALPGLVSCAEAYRDIEHRFPAPGTTNSREVIARSISLFARGERSAGASAHIQARFGKGYVILEPIGIDTLFFSAAQIPASEIYGCEVVDFGANGVDIRFPLRHVGAAFMAPDSGLLLKWCWENNLPSLSQQDYGRWEVARTPLPESSALANPIPWNFYREQALTK